MGLTYGIIRICGANLDVIEILQNHENIQWFGKVLTTS